MGGGRGRDGGRGVGEEEEGGRGMQCLAGGGSGSISGLLIELVTSEAGRVRYDTISIGFWLARGEGRVWGVCGRGGG